MRLIYRKIAVSTKTIFIISSLLIFIPSIKLEKNLSTVFTFTQDSTALQ